MYFIRSRLVTNRNFPSKTPGITKGYINFYLYPNPGEVSISFTLWRTMNSPEHHAVAYFLRSLTPQHRHFVAGIHPKDDFYCIGYLTINGRGVNKYDSFSFSFTVWTPCHFHVNLLAYDFKRNIDSPENTKGNSDTFRRRNPTEKPGIWAKHHIYLQHFPCFLWNFPSFRVIVDMNPTEPNSWNRNQKCDETYAANQLLKIQPVILELLLRLVNSMPRWRHGIYLANFVYIFNTMIWL